MLTPPYPAAPAPAYRPDAYRPDAFAPAWPRRAARLQGEALRFALLAVAHAGLGIVLQRYPILAALHGVVAVLGGAYVAARSTPQAALAAAAYVSGSDVLWRVCGAPFPFEGGKYGVALIALVALVRQGRAVRWRGVPLLYFAAHLPSTLVTFGAPESDGENPFQLVRSYLSGPFSLALVAWLASQVTVTPREFRRIASAFLAPTLAVVGITLFSTYGAGAVEFSTESNLATSGGFGPNQVSTSLGMGALFAVLCALRPDTPRTLRSLLLVAALLSAMQSIMTFSRGGIYAVVLALAAGAWWFVRDARTRRSLVTAVGVVGLVGAGLVLPRLNAFTGGKLQARFESTDTTNRGALMLDDLRIMIEHPVLGVGPGLVKQHRGELEGAGHTEFSRLLAEHGSFGVIALVALLTIGAQVVLRPQRRAVDQGVRVGLAAWGGFSMIHAAMRLSVVGFIIGLAHVRFADEPAGPPTDRAPAR